MKYQVKITTIHEVTGKDVVDARNRIENDMSGNTCKYYTIETAEVKE